MKNGVAGRLRRTGQRVEKWDPDWGKGYKKERETGRMGTKQDEGG